MFHFLTPRKAGAMLASLVACLLFSTQAIAATFTCNNGNDFTTALGNANLTTNDVIILTAGNTFTAPSGGFVLPIKTGTGWITIQSSALSSLPAAGTRVNLTHAINMPKIVPPIFASSAITTATSTPTAAANHYKLIGLEIIGVQNADPTITTTHNLVNLGTTGTTQDTLAEVPQYFVIDRCIVRAATATHRIRRGIAIQSGNTDIINCYISGFKDGSSANPSDTQAICGWNGPGPFNIINNFLEASGENVMFGGSPPSIPNLVPSDIVIQRNHFFKPLTWSKYNTAANGFPPPHWDGINWIIKNLLEFKNGKNALVEGNILENNPGNMGQAGWSIVLTPAADPGYPWTVVKDITIRNNIIRHSAAGPNMFGYDQTGDPSEQTERITFENNLFYDIGGTMWGGFGKLFQITNQTRDVVITHNTAFHTSNFGSTDTGPHDGFVFINNIVNREGGYGFFGSGLSEGNVTLNTLFPLAKFTKNVIKSGNANLYNQYPGNLFPTDWLFMNNKAGGNYLNGDFDIAPGHAYNNAGVGLDGVTPDGKDLGADIPTIITATAGCISGVWGAPPPPSGIIAYDGFNYTGNLNTQNGGTGFGNGWTAVSGQGNPAISTGGSLSYASGANQLTTVGNKLGPSTTNQSVRNFASTISAANTTKWVSFRIKYNGGGALPTNHVGFPLYPSLDGAGTSIFLGKPGNASNWGVDIGGTQSNVSGTAQADAFLLYKLVFTSTQVTVSLWVNPNLTSEASLGTSHITPLTVAHGTQLRSMKMSTGTNSSNYQLDEFRIGNAFADVTPSSAVEVIVDNPAAVKVGTWTSSTWTGGGLFEGTDYIHDGNPAAPKANKTCTWTPNIPFTGSYALYAKWTSNGDRTNAAPYVVNHAGGLTGTITKNQQANGGTWQLIGTYTFNAGTAGYVQLSTAGTTGYVVADAVRFVKQ